MSPPRVVIIAWLVVSAAPSAIADPTVDVTSARVEVDQSPAIAIDRVFEVGEPAFKKDALPLLDAIAKAIGKDSKTNLVIDVHTDDSAPDSDRTGDYLLKLSQARAEAIKAHLVRRGIAARRLTARGLGQTVPLDSNRTDDGRRANRRIEITIEVEIRPPLAADLATYAKALRGTGTAIVATIDTTQGTLHCTLFADRTPITVANFIGLATGQKPWLDPNGKVVRGKPFYDGLIFHRVIPGFMIQGGDPVGTGAGGPGYQFADEIVPELVNKPGTLVMANAGPRTNGSQFFVNEVRSIHLDGRHTVFGQCKELDVVTKIANQPSDRERPLTPVTIRHVTFARAAEAAPLGPPPPPGRRDDLVPPYRGNP